MGTTVAGCWRLLLLVLVLVSALVLSRPTMEKRRVVLRVLNSFSSGFVRAPSSEQLSRIFASALADSPHFQQKKTPFFFGR